MKKNYSLGRFIRYKPLLLAFAFCIAFIFNAKAQSTAPKITGFSPNNGPIGTTVTITGSDFNTNSSDNIVFFGSVKAVVNSATTTQLQVTAPAGASNQPITVLNTATGLIGASTNPFKITFNNAVGQSFNANSFPSENSFSAGYSNPKAKIADFDGDGKNDIVISYPHSNFNSRIVSIFRNTTTGDLNANSFIKIADLYTIQSDFGTEPLAIGDLDGDGKLDIAVADATSKNKSINVFLNTSTPGKMSFTSAPMFISTAQSIMGIVIVDIDGDGKNDIVTSSFSNPLDPTKCVLISKNTTTNLGNISFAAPIGLTMYSSSGTSLLVKDLDGDGKPEIINADGARLLIVPNVSTPGTINSNSFLAPSIITLSENAAYFAIGDLNNDALPEIVAISRSTTNNNISVFQNTSTPGTFVFTQNDFSTNGKITGLILNDLDGDGKLDIITSGEVNFSTNNNIIYLSRNISTSNNIVLETPFQMITNSYVFYMSMGGDLDNDGKTDLFFVDGSQFKVLKNYIGDVIPPLAPTNLTAANAGLQNTLNWTANTENDLAGYKIYGGTSANPTTLLATITKASASTPPANTYIHTGLTIGATYYYRIVAFDMPNNESGFSNEVSSLVKQSQTITFNAINPVVFGAANFNVGATSTNATISLTYSSSNPNVATIDNTGQIQILGVGTTNITVGQPSDANYAAATSVTRQLTVTKAPQTITFAATNSVVLGTADFNPGATSTSTITITYASSNSNVATIVNGNIHIVGAGTTTITANQASDANYLAASKTQTLTVTKGAQTITFAAIPDQLEGNADYTLNATATSGLTISYTSDNNNVVTIVNGKLRVVGSGTANITASQPGDANYAAATPVIRAVIVTANKKDQKIIASNVLTPNGDGKNDAWVVTNILEYPQNEVTIFNRAGKIIYYKKGYTNEWDGTYNGNPLEQGIYYYIIKLGNNAIPVKGSISLIRNNK